MPYARPPTDAEWDALDTDRLAESMPAMSDSVIADFKRENSARSAAVSSNSITVVAGGLRSATRARDMILHLTEPIAAEPRRHGPVGHSTQAAAAPCM